jgi:hypothetical protein
MIRHDKENRRVYLLGKSGTWWWISERDWKYFGINGISDAFYNGQLILHHGNKSFFFV